MASSNTQEVDVLDSWEEIEDSDVLERKFSHMRTTSQPSKCSMSTNGGAPFKIILTGDDPIRSQYVPVEPTVTILKRPSKLNHNVTETKVILPKKTLKQREQEYAEARLRILGEAQCSEKAPSDPSNRFTCIQNKLPHQHQHQRNITDDENVIRMPKGPDGTNGFERR